MDMKKYAEAIEFAAIAHDGVYRKGTKIPYITHVVEAGMIAMTMTQDDNTIIAAILHDIVEDTDYELNDIQSRFGPRVAELVSYESEDKMKEIPANESWKIRKEAFLKHLESAPLEAKIVCLADKLSNMRMSVKTFAEKGDAMWLAFNQKDKKEQEWYYRSIYQKCPELEDTDAYREYVQCCDKVFSKQNTSVYRYCVESNEVRYDPLVPNELRDDRLKIFVEDELIRVSRFFDGQIPTKDLAMPYVFLSDVIPCRIYGKYTDEEVIKELNNYSKTMKKTELYRLFIELIEEIIRQLGSNIEENRHEWVDLYLTMHSAEHVIILEGTDEDKEVFSKIMEIISMRKDYDRYRLGEYQPDRHQIIIYYRAIERDVEHVDVENMDYYAKLSSVIAHEYFHAMHHAMDPGNTLWKNSATKKVTAFQKIEIKEALADFFSILWCYEKAKESNGYVFMDVARERFDSWKKYIYSAWPYSRAIYLMKDEINGFLPISLDEEAICNGLKAFPALLDLSIHDLEMAYKKLRISS